ncbi:MAG: universal stress protein [Acidimicrobiia bacterium]
MRIVVGFVDSPEGEAAIEVAIEEARLRSGGLVIVNSMLGGHHEQPEDYRKMNERLEGLTQRLLAEGIDHDVREYVRGEKPVADIVAAVNEYDAELVVIGIRKRSATGKVLLGSNALDILHDSPVPVLCVKAP